MELGVERPVFFVLFPLIRLPSDAPGVEPLRVVFQNSLPKWQFQKMHRA